MPALRNDPADRNLDGNLIGAKCLELREALRDPEKFKEFAEDPRSFASLHGLQLNATVAEVLRDRLVAAESYEAAQVAEPSIHPAAANPLSGISPERSTFRRPAAANSTSINPPPRRP